MSNIDLHRYPCPQCGDMVLTSAATDDVPLCDLCKVKAQFAPKPALRVVPAYDSNFRMIPQTLRKLASQIENNEIPNVAEAALVLLGDTLEVYGLGPENDGPSTGMLLAAGQLRITRALEEHGRKS